MGGIKSIGGGLIAAMTLGMVRPRSDEDLRAVLNARDHGEMAKLLVGGVFHGELIRDGKVIDEFDVKNLVVNEGLDYMLGATFGTVAPIQSWFLAPFTANYTPVGTDTAASISQNSGEATNYNAATRVPYTPIEANQSVTNAASPATFTFTGAGNIYGAFLISSQAQGATTGKLLAAAQFNSLKAVANGDQLLLTYQFAAASA